ncbi:probable cation-transporting ATPase 13A3 isoform X2 [Teleopsis dalmanni]|uniref:probable cation-transporting ATPase 13A3 isoform X2 n=1 Tax=Teleopsis dalmanni TaxID=139649 RepID=UPI0018CF713F|nr:probable cation-transporting ATPase 13A3 isoform X2 [Teleopsis dalmanni]
MELDEAVSEHLNKLKPIELLKFSNQNNNYELPKENCTSLQDKALKIATNMNTNSIDQRPLQNDNKDLGNTTLDTKLSNIDQYFQNNKNSIAKLNWWNTPTQPISLNDTITTAVVNKFSNNNKQFVSITPHHIHISTAAQCNISPTQNDLYHNKVIPSHQTSPKIGKGQRQSTISEHCDILHNLQVNEEENTSHNSQLLVKDSKPCVGLLNQGEEDEMQVTGYRKSNSRMFLCWLCICMTGGLLRLILHWWRHWYLIATHVQCPLDEAEKVLIQEDYKGKHKIYYVKTVKNFSADDQSGGYHAKVLKSSLHIRDDSDDKNGQLSVHFSGGQFKKSKNIRLFLCKQLRYVWDSQTYSYKKLKGLDVNMTSVYFHQQKGLSAQEQNSRRIVYGVNEISVPYKDIKTLLFLEVLNPFYVFQIFSVILWFTYDYFYYACVIVLMSVFGISMSIMQMKKNQDRLRETVQNTGTALVVSQTGVVTDLPTQSLVPGDIIEIPTAGCTMQCDAVLLSGNCILDESMLTGESVPVTKTPLPVKRGMMYDKKEHARHTLFCGTKVIQTRYIGSEKVLAIVINTGNITAKGGLIRSILYPPPVDYRFEQDSYKFIECLALIALIGFIYTLISKIMREIDPVKIAVESLDLITIVVPPALPAAMTVGRYYAQKRLEAKSIFCISPRSINVAGSINCCCFDKTGTLTEDGLDMWGVVPKSITNQFQIPLKAIERLPLEHFLFCMVTCHSITIMNGKLMGDPLDLKMFESTGWILEDPKDIPDSQKYGLIHPTIVRQPVKAMSLSISTEKPQSVDRQSSVDDLLADVGLLSGESSNDHGIVREFPFTSNLQRMSVITRRLTEKNFNVYCKGSPEMLQQLCKASSLPQDYSEQLATFAKQGYRVIAMAYKSLSSKINYTKAQRLSREVVESDLEFLGFVVLENRLKPDTTDVICSLKAANIRTIMVTGDNILTALSVARDCGIVSSSQAVVTVHVRQHSREQENHNQQYELYYTLELGTNKSNLLQSNEKDKSVMISVNNDPNYKELNSEITSLSSACETYPNSSSLTSLQTCDTWTNRDPEIALNDILPTEDLDVRYNENKNSPTTWRNNYRFAMIGKTWQIVREHFPNELKNFLTRGVIYARMSPEQKQSLITELQNLDYCVAMCGDGANDCGALKVAHTGISLSETESSIASPFTSRNPTIASVPTVIKEGRAALVTSFGIFKYMAAYSMVQFISVMILYSIDSNLTDKQYLYVDLGLISVFAFFFGKTEAYSGPLVKQVPLSSLISMTPLVSIVLHLLVVVGFQVTGWFHLHHQSWFVPFQLSNDDHLGCFENYTMFAISSFQYIILAFVFSKGTPYRKPIYSNIPFCISLTINVFIVVYLIIYPAEWFANFFQLVMPPIMSFRYWMLVYGVCNFLFHVLIESFVVEYLLFKKIHVRRENNIRTSKQKYMQIEYELKYFHSWPPITESYETYELEIREEIKPTYIEISAEQNFDPQPPKKNNPLNNFFEIEESVVTNQSMK